MNKITINVARTRYEFVPLANANLTSGQMDTASNNECTHALRLDGRRPVALVEEAESKGYVCHVLGKTNPHGAGGVPTVTLGLTPIVKPVVARPEPPPAARETTVGPCITVVAPIPVMPPPARPLPAEPVRWRYGDRIRLTEASTAAGHEDRRGHIATVIKCQLSDTRPGEYAVRIQWDNGIDGHPSFEKQWWWAGHFEQA